MDTTDLNSSNPASSSIYSASRHDESNRPSLTSQSMNRCDTDYHQGNSNKQNIEEMGIEIGPGIGRILGNYGETTDDNIIKF